MLQIKDSCYLCWLFEITPVRNLRTVRWPGVLEVGRCKAVEDLVRVGVSESCELCI